MSCRAIYHVRSACETVVGRAEYAVILEIYIHKDDLETLCPLCWVMSEWTALQSGTICLSF